MSRDPGHPGHRRRGATARAPDRQRPLDPGSPAGRAGAGAVPVARGFVDRTGQGPATLPELRRVLAAERQQQVGRGDRPGHRGPAVGGGLCVRPLGPARVPRSASRGARAMPARRKPIWCARVRTGAQQLTWALSGRAPGRLVRRELSEIRDGIAAERRSHGARLALTSRDMTVTVGIGPVSFDDVVAVARGDAAVETRRRGGRGDRRRAAATSRRWPPTRPRSTGFRPDSARWPPGTSRTRCVPQLQRSLIRSHAAGSGPEVEREVVRAMMLLRLSTLASGRTGVRRETAQAYADLLSAGLTPVVYEYGSLGCSGDLAPLAHVALAVMGEGQVRTRDGELQDTGRRAARPRPEPGHLRREGGPGPDQRHRRHARPAGARPDRSGPPVPAGRYRRRHERRRAAGHRPRVRRRPAAAAAAPRTGRRGREHARAAGRFGDRGQPPGPRTARVVQDAYSLRCAPQVAGAARDTAAHARMVAERELASVIDNPVVTLDGRVESNGNFHGAPVAYVLDFLAIVVADLASISERRTDRFLDVARNHGLNAFLAARPRRRQRAHDRPVHPGRRSSPSSSGWPVPPAPTRFRRRRCRRTTCRWGGRRRANCGARSTA